MSWGFAGFLGTLIAMVIIAGVINYYYAQRELKRAESLFSFAMHRGLEYVGSLPTSAEGFGFFAAVLGQDSFEPGFLTPFQCFEPFGKGESPEVSHLVAGTRGVTDFYAFDYSYQQDTGKSKATFRHAVVAARVPIALPALSLSPENVLTRIGQSVGVHELKVELDEFNSRYFIKCDDERAAFDFLCPTMIEHLMACPTRHWQLAGTHIMVHRSGKLTGHYAYQVMEELETLLRRIPALVQHDRGFERPWAHALDT